MREVIISPGVVIGFFDVAGIGTRGSVGVINRSSVPRIDSNVSKSAGRRA